MVPFSLLSYSDVLKPLLPVQCVFILCYAIYLFLQCSVTIVFLSLIKYYVNGSDLCNQYSLFLTVNQIKFLFLSEAHAHALAMNIYVCVNEM